MEKRIEELEEKWEKGITVGERKKEIEDLKRRISKLERGDRRRAEDKGEGRHEVEERMKKIERAWEGKERMERKKNVVMKGFKLEKEGERSKIEKIFKQIRAKVGIKEIRVVKTGREEWERLAIVKLGTKDETKKVMMKKKELRGDKVWIDLTWRERRSR